MKVDIVESDNSAEAAFDAMRRHLETAERPDAIYALNTPLLQGALRAVRALGWRIPEDISLLGFDDFEWAEFLDPPMTVVDQHIGDIGRVAGELIVEMLAPPLESEASRPARQVAVQPTLVIRQSCRAVQRPPSA